MCIRDRVGGYVDRMLNERLLSVLSTKENVNLATLGFAEENVKKYQAIITPIDIAGERLGTLFIYKSDAQYDIDEDVYKRQAMSRDENRADWIYRFLVLGFHYGREALDMLQYEPIYRVFAVSYTHLDVYKRQVYTFPFKWKLQSE